MTRPLHPGVWRAAAWSCHARTSIVTEDPGSPTGTRLIADVGGGGQLLEDMESTALVMAASKELLAAADAAAALLRRQGWRVGDTFNPEAVVLTSLIKAIEKARTGPADPEQRTGLTRPSTCA